MPTLESKLFAQQKGYSIGIDGGLSMANNFQSSSYSLEVKRSIKNNINVGIKFSAARLTKLVYLEEYGVANDFVLPGRDYSILGCLDYQYFKSEKIAPYVGIGLGFTRIADLKPIISISSVLFQTGHVDSYWRPGLMVRTGLEFSFMRIGVEYFLTQATTINPNDQFMPGGLIFDPVSNQYLNVHLGFFFGVNRGKDR